MAPSSLIDASTYTPVPTKSVTLPRTLLLAPPSLSSHPESLDRILEAHSRQTTDIQMLDRLFLSLVQLPPATYTTIIILTDADGTRSESRSLLSSVAITQLVAALKLGGTLRSQDGTFASKAEPAERREAILAGLIVSDDGVMKPDYDTTATIPLGLGRNRGSQITSNNGSVSNGTTTSASAATGIASTTSPAGTGVTSVNISDHRYNGPAGVGFVDFSDDFDAVEEEGSDDELIDEDTLLEESDFSRPVIQRTSPPLSLTYKILSLILSSPGMPPRPRQAPPRLQRLLLRPGTEARSRRRCQACRSRPGSREAQSL